MAHILVVDDEPDVVELLQYSLEKSGHHVQGARNGQEGLDSARHQRPDLIILDIMMPVMDGYSMSTHLMEDDETRRIPVIVLTAKDRMREVFDPVPSVRMYLEKPFDPAELRRIVNGVLQQAS